jgi:hypothetical protein
MPNTCTLSTYVILSIPLMTSLISKLFRGYSAKPADGRTDRQTDTHMTCPAFLQSIHTVQECDSVKACLMGCHFLSYIKIRTNKERRNCFTPSRSLVQSCVLECLLLVEGCMETLAWLIRHNYTNEMLLQKKVSGPKFACHSTRQGVLCHADRSRPFKDDVPETSVHDSRFSLKRV